MAEFIRGASDNRRVVIVDIMHMMYKYAFGGSPVLSATVMVDGQPKVINTTLCTHSIKSLYRWSHGGYYPLVVCFDAPGANRSRRAYFAKHSTESGQAVGYKESRNFNDDQFYQGVNTTFHLLRQGGVTCLKSDNYEADDLIKAAVDKAKAEYPHLPIDIITGDQDMLPLVDEQVSVFLSSKRSTWAEDKDLEKRGYMQLRPDNMQSYVEATSDFKGLSIPYNVVLLKKLLRGKKADDIPGYPKFTPTKFNNLIAQLQEDGHDLGTLFRYGTPIKKVVYRGTGEEISADMVASVPVEQKMLKFEDPVELTHMLDVLGNYLDDDIIEHIRFIYRGVNLNQAYTDVPETFKRKPAVITAPIQGYIAAQLQQAVNPVLIHLPVL